MKSRQHCANHYISSITNSRAEMFTTDLGLAAYEGKADKIKLALEKGVDWASEGPYLLSSAMFGHQWDIARNILKGGMPISDSTYKEIYYWGDHSLLNELPPRPDLIDPLIAETKRNAFIRAIIEGDLAETKKLFQPEWVNTESSVLGDRVSRRPIHFAAQICQLEILRFLLENGANVNALTGENQSALTLVSRCPSVENKQRRECFKLLRSYGGELIPQVDGWYENWRLSRGGWMTY